MEGAAFTAATVLPVMPLISSSEYPSTSIRMRLLR
jgi:hypothetical protein